MSDQHCEKTPYSSHTLFSDNHIKSNQILTKIKQNKIQEVLEGYAHIKDDAIVMDLKYSKYYANQYTYDIMTNYIDNLVSQLTNKFSVFNVYINIQSLSLTDIDKHNAYFKYIALFLSDKYPDRLNKCYIYNASAIFETVLNIMNRFIDKETQDKLHVIKE